MSDKQLRQAHMQRRASLPRRLDPLPGRSRMAAGATCVEHVLDLYRDGSFRFTVADAPPGTIEAAGNADLVEESIRVAWGIASGDKPNKRQLDALVTTLDGTPAGIDPEDENAMNLGGLVTVAAVRHLLKAATDVTPQSITYCLETCEDALHDGLKTCADFLGKGELALYPIAEPEGEWQQRVIARVEQLGDQNFRRNMFADLIAEKLPWRSYLAEYARMFRPRATH